MDHKFTAEEWARLSWLERVRQCRSMAESARQLAERARPDLQEHYKDLCKSWLDLAQEIEATMTACTTKRGKTRSTPFPGPG